MSDRRPSGIAVEEQGSHYIITLSYGIAQVPGPFRQSNVPLISS